MNNISRIIVIVDSIDIQDSSGSKANVALIHNLQAIGYHIEVFHYTRKNIQLKNVVCHSIKENKWSLNYFLSRSQRVFTRYTKININSFIEKIMGFSFTFLNDTDSIRSFILNNINKEPDLIITLSKGASFRPHYALLKLPKYHNKWLAYVHDPYPFHCYPEPYNWIEAGYKRKEIFFKEVSEKAKFSGFPSQLLNEWMGTHFPNFLNTGILIPHQSFNQKFNKIESPKYCDINKFNILHAGNLMKQRSPKGLIVGFQLFLKNNPSASKDARLLLLGSSSYYDSMLSTYKNEIQELYVSEGNVPFEIVLNLQKNVVVNVILESKSKISPFLPGKFPHCVIANKPILLLSPNKSETKRLLGADYLYHTQVDAVIEIAKLFQKLYDLWLVNPNNLKLDRKDLEHYVSTSYLDEIIKSII